MGMHGLWGKVPTAPTTWLVILHQLQHNGNNNGIVYTKQGCASREKTWKYSTQLQAQ